MAHDPYLATSLTGTDIDVGAYRVGVVYAKALLGAAHSAGQLQEVIDEIESFIEAVMPHPHLEELLGSGMISPEDKVAMIDRVFKGRASPLFINFLKVVAAHGRGGCLRAIVQAARDQVDEMKGRVRVQVITATPLEPQQEQPIVERLRALTKAEPVLVKVVDPNKLGGLIFRIGDTVYDGSVSSQLERARIKMIQRSVHEIQSRRDRFSHSA